MTRLASPAASLAFVIACWVAFPTQATHPRAPGFDVSGFDEGLDWPTCDPVHDSIVCQWALVPEEDWLELEDRFVEVRTGTPGADILETDIVLGEDDDTAAVIHLGGDGNDTHRAHLGVGARESIARQLFDLGDGDDVLEAEIHVDDAEDVSLTNQVYGRGGDDRIDAVADAQGAYGSGHALNAIDGGAGDDEISAYAVDEFGGCSTQAENRIAAGEGDDLVDATAIAWSNSPGWASNAIFGDDGDDVLRARALSDSNAATPIGVNALWGGRGDDQLEARHHTDGENYVTDLTTVLVGEAGNDELLADTRAWGENVLAYHELDGGTGHDTLTSRIDVDVYYPEHFNETVNLLAGGPGNDQLEAWLTAQPLDMYYDPEYDAPYLPRGENQLRGGNGRDLLLAVVVEPLVGSSVLEGGNGPDRLIVVGGTNNALDGGNGRDDLHAGTGNDRMAGGRGPDTFHFDLAEDQGENTIVDFEPGRDGVAFTGPGGDPDAVSTFEDMGQGKDVVVVLASGTRITFEGIGTGKIRSWRELSKRRGRR